MRDLRDQVEARDSPSASSPRTRSRRLTIAGAVCLVVAIAVVVAVAWMSAPRCCDTRYPAIRPDVTLQLNGTTGGGADVLATSVDLAVPASDYRVNLRIGTSFGWAAWLPYRSDSSVLVSYEGANFTVAWHDSDGSGTVSVGDHFEVRYPTGAAALSPGTALEFFLIWSDGSTLATQGWTA